VSGSSANPNDTFAWAYDRHFDSKSAERALEKLFLPKMPKGARILDLCCGPGRVARYLSDGGYSVTGVDSSPRMLRLASQNAPSCELVEADARTFELGRTFQGCVCLSASVNQFMVLAELGKVFERVRSHLVPGGLFLFDMNIERTFASRWKAPYATVSEGDALIVRPRFDPETNVANVEMTAFRLADSGGWERSDASFQQRCYSERDVRSELKRALIRDVKVRGSGDLGMEESGPAFFVGAR